MKRQDTDWDKKLQITYLTKDSHLEYIQNSQNSTIKKIHIPILENGQRTQRDNSLKKI